METSKLTLKQIRISEIGDCIKILSLDYDNIETKSFEDIAKIISQEFNVQCSTLDVEKYYEIDINEDFEKESRRVEYGN